MKKTLLALSLVSMFGLSACSDGFMLNDNKTKTESVDSFSLESAYTGPGKDYKPTVDPTRIFNLYKISYTYKKNGEKYVRFCNKKSFIEDQLDRSECLRMRRTNISRDQMNSDKIDIDQENATPAQKSIYEDGPLKGKRAWEYWCLKPAGVKAYSDYDCDTGTKNGINNPVTREEYKYD